MILGLECASLHNYSGGVRAEIFPQKLLTHYPEQTAHIAEVSAQDTVLGL